MQLSNRRKRVISKNIPLIVSWKKRVRKSAAKMKKSYVQRIDMLHFQQEEIAAADLQVGEEEKLKEEREKLSNYQKNC